MSETIDCPRCGKLSPAGAAQCDCGLVFDGSNTIRVRKDRHTTLGGILGLVALYLTVVQPLFFLVFLVRNWGAILANLELFADLSQELTSTLTMVTIEHAIRTIFGVLVGIQLRHFVPSTVFNARRYFAAMVALPVWVVLVVFVSSGRFSTSVAHLTRAIIPACGYVYFRTSRRVRATYWTGTRAEGTPA